MKRFRWLSLVVLLFAMVYFVSYNVKTVLTKDTEGPVITLEEEELHISVKDGDDVLLADVTADDVKDGDVTESVVIESISDFTGEKERYVNYAAFDSDNHVSKVSRKVVYTDYTPPRFEILEPLQFVVSNSKTQDILGSVRAVDCMEGDISDKIRFSAESSISVNLPGKYQAELEVTNSAGDTTTLPVQITIYDVAEVNETPRIVLSDYLIYIKPGENLDPKSYLQSVSWHGTEYSLTEGRGTFDIDTSEMDSETLSAYREELQSSPSVSYAKFAIQEQVDYQTPGVYRIDYLLEDENENVGEVNLIVVVEEE